MPFTRRFWVIVHRWAGLTLALFLGIAGVTGAIIPFEEALNFATRPSLAKAMPPVPGAAPLDAVTIAERVERQTGGVISYLPLEVPRDHAVRMFVSAAPGASPLPYDFLWVDPYTGKVNLAFTWGGLSDGPENIVPFLYQLHYGYVAGPWGMWAFGVAALVWTIDCFVGFGLTLPLHLRSAGDETRLRALWRRWRPSWQIRRARGYKLTFDIHRASGLWLWPMLLVFAWSGVALALPSIERPVMKLFGATGDFTPPQRAQPLVTPPIGRREAITIGMRDLRRIGAARGFVVEQSTMLAYAPDSGTYALYARTGLDAVSEGGRTTLWIDAVHGRAIHLDDPIGTSRADRVMTWLTLLHMAEVFGLPYKIFTSLLGLLVTTLSVTGVLIWLRKRSARIAAAGKLLPHRLAIRRAARVRLRRAGLWTR